MNDGLAFLFVGVIVLLFVVGIFYGIFYLYQTGSTVGYAKDKYVHECRMQQFVFVSDYSSGRYFCIDPKNKSIVSELAQKE